MSRLIAFLLYLALIVTCLGALAFAAANYFEQTRGVESFTSAPQKILGTNVALEQYTSDAELDRALAQVKAAGLTSIRQYFPWREIETAPAHFEWGKWDRLVQHARALNLDIVAVLNTAPAWTQRDYERDTPTAPPNNPADYATFASEFARQYGEQIHYYEIWDEPNVHPGWGKRNVDPTEYARLLQAAAQAIRATDSHAKIVLAGLAMNLQTQRPHLDYSEILFLRELYKVGAQKDFDIVAAKPYGMWSGPEDRQVSSEVLNFSRLVLLREEMRAHGDAGKPVWAVEMGWNALPSDWQGAPSPWGTDAEAKQADRLTRALVRANSEWSWLSGIFPQMFEPNTPPDDPRWGFSLVTRDLWQPRAFYTALAGFAKNPPPLSSDPRAGGTEGGIGGLLPVLALIAVASVATWRGLRMARTIRLRAWGTAFVQRFCLLPEIAQFAILAVAVAVFYFSPSLSLTLVALVLLVPLVALRMDLGLALLVLAIPFFLYPKTLFGGFAMSLVEVLTLVSVAAWGLRATLANPSLAPLVKGGRKGVKITSLDLAVMFLVLLGFISTRVAANFGVANREFRVIVVEPALLYGLVRATHFSRAQLSRLVLALLLSGVAVCLIAFVQFARGDVIVVDTIRRIHAVWESPNNAALFLGRLLPISLALTLMLPRTRARWWYLALTGLLALTILLTFSLGGLLIGVPASVLVVAGLWLWQARGRVSYARVVIVGIILLGVVALVVVTNSARFAKLFDPGTGTGFFRVAVWTSGVNMIRDHPLFGVGLDNFLYEYPKYILPEAWREPNLSHPHNVVLDFWVRLGIFGLLVFAWLEFEFFRRAWRAFRASNDILIQALALGLMGSMVDFLAHGMFDAAYFVVDLAFVFMLTLGLVATADGRRLTDG